jgi:DNA-binding XRE family transcriptional regulator
MAHRYSYELHKGLIPDGLTIDHLCKIRHCVNPQHLEVVTYQENNHRGNGMSGCHFRATHCPKGHPYSGDNLYVRPDGKGRGCKICRSEINTNLDPPEIRARAATSHVKALEEKGFTPQQIAEMVGVSRNTIYGWRAGTKTPWNKFFVKLEEVVRNHAND